MQKTNVGAQKIAKSSLKTYSMIIIVFQILNKLGCFQFFQKSFLLTNIRMEVVLGMFFLTFSNANI